MGDNMEPEWEMKAKVKVGWMMLLQQKFAFKLEYILEYHGYQSKDNHPSQHDQKTCVLKSKVFNLQSADQTINCKGIDQCRFHVKLKPKESTQVIY
jgi:hypothetical protein